MTTDRYSLTELADLAGVSVRTVRYYQSQGLLSSSGTSGPGAKYDEAHLARLQLIRRLQRDHLPLAEIRRRLADLDDATVMTLAENAPQAPPQDSALDYVRGVLASGSAPPASPRFARRAAEMPAAAYAMSVQLTPPEPPPADARVRIERSQWERIELATDVELHVRRPLPRPLARQVDRLIAIATDLLKEDPS